MDAALAEKADDGKRVRAEPLRNDRNKTGVAVSTAGAVASSVAVDSSGYPVHDYRTILLIYYEEEVEGEAYFHSVADRLTDPDEARKMHLLGDVERKAADSVKPLLTKRGLTPRPDEELHRGWKPGVPSLDDSKAPSYAVLCTRWLKVRQ